MWVGNIPKDSGLFPTDEHEARFPKHPWTADFHAIGIKRPDLRFDKIDVVTSKGMLHRLMMICQGYSPSVWRFTISMVQDTMFLDRHHKVKFVRFHDDFERPRWGHNFESLWTRKPQDLADASNHYRILRYNIGGLDCVVRTEADAYMPENIDFELSSESSHQPMVLDDSQYHEIQVVRRGVSVPQKYMVELKTRTMLKKFDYYLPGLWFTRTPYLIRGIHDNGVVSEINTNNLAAAFEEWENEGPIQTSLQKLESLLHMLRDVCKAHGGKRLAVVCHRFPWLSPDRPILEIYEIPEASRPDPLPPFLIKKFWPEKDVTTPFR